jgi:NAD(P)-dependent dehydrogenase (short-subunit alcohol dehydrogenase family)
MVDINLTGVVHGIAAAAPHLRAAGGGSIVVLASLAGIVPQQGNPFYSMTKAGLIGLVRALGPDLAEEGIRIAAVCPGFADTPMITTFREVFVDAGFPLLTAENVADAVLRAAEEGESGTCWVVQPGREPIAYAFRGVPGAMKVDGSVAAVPASAK